MIGASLKITILYDNRSAKEGLRGDWGFSCLVETPARKILFDTGAKGPILLDHMAKLGVDPALIDEIVISHHHWDHTGGLADVLAVHPVPVYIPPSCPEPQGADEVIQVKEAREIHENIFSTGELDSIEQSLLIGTEKGLVAIVGCSHPGVGKIIKAARRFGKVRALIGGLHGFVDFDLIENLDVVCPVHCTKHISEIRSRYPGKYIEGGVGKVIEWPETPHNTES